MVGGRGPLKEMSLVGSIYKFWQTADTQISPDLHASIHSLVRYVNFLLGREWSHLEVFPSDRLSDLSFHNKQRIVRAQMAESLVLQNDIFQGSTAPQAGLSFLNRISNHCQCSCGHTWLQPWTLSSWSPSTQQAPRHFQLFSLSYSCCLSQPTHLLLSFPSLYICPHVHPSFLQPFPTQPSPTIPPHLLCSFSQFSLNAFSSLVFSVSLVPPTHLFIVQKVFIVRYNRSVGKNVEKLEAPNAAGGDIQWYTCCGKV